MEGKVCGRKTEVYSRVVGYYRPVSQWNNGKRSEFEDRTEFVVGDGSAPRPREVEEVPAEQPAAKDEEEAGGGMTMFEKGMKVAYVSGHGTIENGIVKELHPTMPAAWVVYKCGGDWENYRDYTGALTELKDLVVGWRGPDQDSEGGPTP